MIIRFTSPRNGFSVIYGSIRHHSVLHASVQRSVYMRYFARISLSIGHHSCAFAWVPLVLHVQIGVWRCRCHFLILCENPCFAAWVIRWSPVSFRVFYYHRRVVFCDSSQKLTARSCTMIRSNVSLIRYCLDSRRFPSFVIVDVK